MEKILLITELLEGKGDITTLFDTIIYMQEKYRKEGRVIYVIALASMMAALNPQDKKNIDVLRKKPETMLRSGEMLINAKYLEEEARKAEHSLLEKRVKEREALSDQEIRGIKEAARVRFQNDFYKLLKSRKIEGSSCEIIPVVSTQTRPAGNAIFWSQYSFTQNLEKLFPTMPSQPLPTLNEIIVIPSAHRIISINPNIDQMRLDNLISFFDQVGSFIDLSDCNTTLCTELCRRDNSMRLASVVDSLMDIDAAPPVPPLGEKKIYIYESIFDRGHKDYYIYVNHNEDGHIISAKFMVRTSYIKIDESENVQCLLPQTPSEKVGIFSDVAKGEQESKEKESLNILTYIPTDSPSDPLNFTKENCIDAVQSEELCQKLAAHGYKAITCTMIGMSGKIDPIVYSGVTVNIDCVDKISPYKSFLEAIQCSDLYIASGDHSYLESLETAYNGITLYCARDHKHELAQTANYVFNKIFQWDVPGSLRCIQRAPVSQSPKGEDESRRAWEARKINETRMARAINEPKTIAALTDVMLFAAQKKLGNCEEAVQRNIAIYDNITKKLIIAVKNRTRC